MLADGTTKTTSTLTRNTTSKGQAIRLRNKEFNTIYDYFESITAPRE